MRTPRLAALSAVAALLAPALVVACAGDDTSVGDAGAVDASRGDATTPDDAADALPRGDAARDSAMDASVDAAADAAGGADARDSAPAADPCATDGGDAGFTTRTFDWSFAVSSTALNGGKGQVIAVKRCDSVRWHNPEAATHSVVSTDGTIDTGSILFGATSAPIQMKRAGVFPYVCGIHGAVMSGELTVQ